MFRARPVGTGLGAKFGQKRLPKLGLVWDPKRPEIGTYSPRAAGPRGGCPRVKGAGVTQVRQIPYKLKRRGLQLFSLEGVCKAGG